MLPGTLIVICGLPCSGKTTLAKGLESERSALRLCPDEWIADLLPENWTRDELDRLRAPVEKLQWEVAWRSLALGINVILEWGSWQYKEREFLRAGAQAVGAGFELHYLDVELDELLRRLAARNANLAHGTFALAAEEIRAWWQQIERPTQEELALRW